MRMPDYIKTGDGPVTIFLFHGGYGAKEYWRHEIAALVAAGYRTIAWDAPGYGLSDLSSPYSIEMVGDAAIALFDATSSERNVVFGHSMGGLIAPRVASARPNAVQAVVISASLASLGQGGAAFSQDFIEQRVPPLRSVARVGDVAMPLLRSMFAPGATGAAVDLVLEIAAQTPSATFIEAMLAIARYDGEPVVRSLQQPTLCVAGAHDPVGRPELVEALAAMIPKGQFALFDRAGHYPFAECQNEFDRRLLQFLRENDLSPHTA